MAEGQRNPEIGDQGLIALEQDVFRLDITMKDALPVGVLERADDLRGEPDRLPDRELPLPTQPASQRLALDEGHDVEQHTPGGAGIEQRKDMGVLEIGGHPDFFEESLGADHGHQFRPEDLDGHRAVMPKVAGQEHQRHPALGQLALHQVSIAECQAELIEHRRQR